jgi:hypothetical protein
MDEDSIDDADDTISALTEDASVHSSPAHRSSSDQSTKSAFSSLNILSKAKNAFSRKPSVLMTTGISEDEDEDNLSINSGSKASPAPLKTSTKRSATSALISGLGVIGKPLAFTSLVAAVEPIFGAGHNITEAIQWVIQRHHSLITIIPPDIYLTIAALDLYFRQEVIDNARKNIGILSLRSIVGAVIISSPVLGNNQDGAAFDKSVGGFASLAGALIQVRLSIESSTVQLAHILQEKVIIEEPAHIDPSTKRRLSQIEQHVHFSADELDSAADSNSLVDGEVDEGEYELEDDTDNTSVNELTKFYAIEAPPKPSLPTPPSFVKAAETDTLVTIFLSKVKEQFLVLCVVLDNDIKVTSLVDILLYIYH